MSVARPARRVLLTGATGYVGGRLLTALEAGGYHVRCLVRRPEALQHRAGPRVEVVAGDVQDPASLERALAECDVVYYLVHSMGVGAGFEEADRRAAASFGQVAHAAGVRRIIYLGGLGSGGTLSPHLASRQEVGRLLAASGVPTIEFRASIVIGSGSLSFEMIRALVERLPIMVAPRWVRTPTQPIAVEDLIAYLLAGLDLDTAESQVFEIGGADVVSYEGLMTEFARQRGLRRLLLPVPVLSPALSSLWLGLVTPLYARVGRKLIDSLRNATVVTNDRARRTFAVRPRGYREAIARALANEDRELAETRWSDALSAGGLPRSWTGVRFGSRLVDSRAIRVAVPPPVAFEPIARLGGQTGWYTADALWRLRGFLDLLVGGVGLRRGRRDPRHLVVGDAVDFWRVEAIEPSRLLRLAAEMRLPGRAWLVFEIEPDGPGSVIRQTALFDPVGVLGLAYWYALYPLHRLVFSGMLRGIARQVTPGPPSRTPERGALLVALAASAVAQGLGGWFTSRSVTTWYPTLIRPAWTPPDWVFGPVWTGLYLVMAVAAWLVWRERARVPVHTALTLYATQLILNTAWSGLFFGLRDPGAGLVGIAALSLAIGATLVAFGRVRRLAGWLLVPYLAWVSYAASLSWAIWRLNE